MLYFPFDCSLFIAPLCAPTATGIMPVSSSSSSYYFRPCEQYLSSTCCFVSCNRSYLLRVFLSICSSSARLLFSLLQSFLAFPFPYRVTFFRTPTYLLFCFFFFFFKYFLLFSLDDTFNLKSLFVAWLVLLCSRTGYSGTLLALP